MKRIFFDERGHWDRFVAKHGGKLRANVRKEVEKFRRCGDPRNGFKLMVCEGCHDLRLVPYRCKGRFCTTCSCGETEEWARLLEQDVFQVNHRHVVFTIDEGLREIFLLHRAKLLKEFMDEACLEDGKLKVKNAMCSTSKACLERMIRDVAGVKETKGSEEKEKAAKRAA